MLVGFHSQSINVHIADVFWGAGVLVVYLCAYIADCNRSLAPSDQSIHANRYPFFCAGPSQRRLVDLVWQASPGVGIADPRRGSLCMQCKSESA